MTSSDFTSVFLVVREISIRKFAILVPDQTKTTEMCRIKVELNFYILGNRNETSRKLVDKYLPCLVHRIDIGICSVSFVSQTLHSIVFVIACPKSKNTQEYIGFRFVRNQFDQVSIVGNTNIEITIRTKNNAVRTTWNEIVDGHFIGQPDTRSAVCRTRRFQTIDRLENDLFAMPPSRNQRYSRVSGVGDNGNPVVLSQLTREQVHCPLHQR